MQVERDIETQRNMWTERKGDTVRLLYNTDKQTDGWSDGWTDRETRQT